MTCGSIVDLKEAIERDLLAMSQSEVDMRAASSLAECAACALAVKSSNSCEWMTVFPRICAKKSKERAISRLLSSPLIDGAEVMSYYIPEVVKKLSKNGESIILMLDKCMVSYCRGDANELKHELSPIEKGALWDKYYTAAPERRRQCAEKYKIVKRA